MMTKFSIFMMILFLFCGYGANNGGGTFAFIEVLMAMSMDDNEKLENLVLLFAIAAQVAGVYAIIRSNSGLGSQRKKLLPDSVRSLDASGAT